MRCRILGVGACLPSRVVTNDEVAPLARIRPERIQKLFDVRQRHWVRQRDRPDPADGEHCSDIGAEAARRAIRAARIDAAAVDLVVTASTTPDFMGPSLDALVSRKLGLRNTLNIDLRSACAGLFRAVAVVEGMMATGRCRTALVVVAEALSPFFRFGPDVPADHRLSTVLYGDGAGALVLVAGSDDGPGVEALIARTTGDDVAPGIFARGLLSSTPPTHERVDTMEYLGFHDFHTVLARGADMTWHAAEEMFRATGTSMEDYKLLVTHQATGKLHQIGARYGIPPEKFPTNIEHVGNTIGASILILLDELCREEHITAGDRLLLYTAESSTWSWASMSVLWG